MKKFIVLYHTSGAGAKKMQTASKEEMKKKYGLMDVLV